MASRNIDDLHPDLQPLCRTFMYKADAQGLDPLITCTWRSNKEQDALYAQGRTTPGLIVTRARGGQSAHNFILNGLPAAKAFDVVPMENGKPIWNSSYPVWDKLGKIGTDLGLNWYGADTAPFKEKPHFQLID